MTKSNILLIDDDSDVVLSLTRALKTQGCEFPINAATSPKRALELFDAERPAVCALDLCLNKSEGTASGLSLLKEFLLRDPTVRVIILTGHGSSAIGIESLNQGAASFLEKPAEPSHLLALIRDGITQCLLKRSVVDGKVSIEAKLSDLLVAESEAMKPVLELVYQASQTQQAVLITGETGTGKGLCASVIHRVSKRSNRNFVKYHPTHTSPDLVMSEIFGHRKGAFTGADVDRPGLMELAHGGTLFIDEIDELPLSSQIALLGVLQDKLFRPLGQVKDIHSEFRLISATNREPSQVVESGKLRRDLFYRIGHLRIVLPPLRARLADIPALARYFLRQVSHRDSLRVCDISNSAETELLNFSWPGNVRELAARIEDCAYRAHFLGSLTISKDILVSSFRNHHSHAPKRQGLFGLIERYRYQIITEALQRSGGNVTAAARDLGVDRMVIRNTMQKSGE